jgi:hypothetical protein
VNFSDSIDWGCRTTKPMLPGFHLIMVFSFAQNSGFANKALEAGIAAYNVPADYYRILIIYLAGKTIISKPTTSAIKPNKS